MASTPSRNETARPRPRLLIYGIGFVLLTNVLTVLFIFLLRSPRLASIAVVPARAAPAAEASAPGAAAPADDTRQVHVTSRPSGAVVRYQGDVQGTTPLTVALPAGEAGVLNLEKDGYRSRSVTVKPGDNRVRVRLYHTPAAGADAARPGGAGPAAGGTPARTPGTPAETPGAADAPATPPRTTPRTAPDTAPRATPEAPRKATSEAPRSAAPATAAKETTPPAARTAQPKPARRPAADSPEQPQGADSPAAGANKAPAPRAE